MKKIQIRWTKEFTCLLVTSLMVAFTVIRLDPLHRLEYYITDTFMIIPIVLFAYIVHTGDYSREGKRAMYIGLACAAWFCVAQMLQKVLQGEARNPSYFMCACLVAFPYPFVAGKQDGEKGLHLTGYAYTAACVGMCIGSLALVMEWPVQMPTVFYWMGDRRLYAALHPVTGSTIFMLGMLICLSQMFRLKKVWQKLLCVLIMVGCWFFQALANGRTAVVMSAAVIAAVVFFWVFQKRDWKRFLAGVLAGVVIFAGMCSFSSAIFRKSADILTQKWSAAQMEAAAEEADEPEIEEAVEPVIEEPAPAEMIPVPQDEQMEKPTGLFAQTGDRTLTDTTTLGTRFDTWRGVIQALKDRPRVLLGGTQREKELILEYTGVDYAHTHNSYLEVTMWLGLPGLFIALYFTFLAVRSGIWLVLFDPNMERKTVAITAMGLLVCGMMDPFLFTSANRHYFVNYFFFLCTGYMEFWYQHRKDAD